MLSVVATAYMVDIMCIVYVGIDRSYLYYKYRKSVDEHYHTFWKDMIHYCQLERDCTYY